MTRNQECSHLRCGIIGHHVVKHETEERGEWFERVCEKHAEKDIENDRTAVEVVVG